jgi:hypothetical protein
LADRSRFDEWYGPLRTYDECMWLDDPFYVPERDGYSYMHEGRKDEGVWPIIDQQLTTNMKKKCDLEYQKRGLDFMKRSAAADTPFFLYFNHSLMHFPMIPRDEFKGLSGRERAQFGRNRIGERVARSIDRGACREPEGPFRCRSGPQRRLPRADPARSR